MADNSDIPASDRAAFQALADADDRQCNNAFNLLARVERRVVEILGIDDEIGVQPELRAAVAVAIHEVLAEIEVGLIKAIRAVAARQVN